MKCPLCNNVFSKNVCSNDDCELSWVTPTDRGSINLKRIFWKIWYWRPRDGYYYIKNRFFKRYDLIRTGLGKHSWWDTDGRIESGMMALLVQFVEDEEALRYFYENERDDSSDVNEHNNLQSILDLYIDIKVNLPKLEHENAEALTLWASDHHLNIGKPEQVGDSKLTTSTLTTSYGKPKEVEVSRWDNLQRLDIEVEKMRTDILHRIVDIRGYLWT